MSSPHGKSAALKALRVKLAKSQEQVHQLKAERDAAKKNTWWFAHETEYPEEGAHLIAAPTAEAAEAILRKSWGEPDRKSATQADFDDEVPVSVEPADDLDVIEEWLRSEDTAFTDRLKQQLVLSPTWPYVLAFACRMEAKLEKNRHKGNREGWTKDTVHALFWGAIHD